MVDDFWSLRSEGEQWVNSVLGGIPETVDDIAHIGIKRRSGRFAWGSGMKPFQHEPFKSLVNTFRSPRVRKMEAAKKMSDEELDAAVDELQNQLNRLKKEAKLVDLQMAIEDYNTTKVKNPFLDVCVDGMKALGKINSDALYQTTSQLVKYGYGTLINEIAGARVIQNAGFKDGKNKTGDKNKVQNNKSNQNSK